MRSAEQSRLNFLKLINYPAIYGGQQHAQNRYDPPLQCDGFCVVCERAMFADGSRSEIGSNVPSDYLSKISHAADTSDLETILGPLPLPSGAKYNHARVFLVFEAPNKGKASDTSWGRLCTFHGIEKHVPVHFHYWACPKQNDWPEGWPNNEDDLLGLRWSRWVPYGGYLAYLVNRYHLKNAYITNGIKCGKASGAYNFTCGSTDERVLSNCTKVFLNEEIRLTPPKVIFPFGERATQICKRAEHMVVEGLLHPKRPGVTPRAIIRHNDSVIEPALRAAGLLSGSLEARETPPRPNSHVLKPISGGGRVIFRSDVNTPDPDRFQWVLVPLIRREFSINELINLFLSGPLDRSGDSVLADLFGNGIVDRNTDRARIRAWIIARLKGRGLDPACSLYGVFKFIAYSGEGSFQNLTIENIDGVRDDVPIRIICRREWFQRYGGNPACRRYFGGNAENQAVFYGEGGRFRLRPGVDVPLDCP